MWVSPRLHKDRAGTPLRLCGLRVWLCKVGFVCQERVDAQGEVDGPRWDMWKRSVDQKTWMARLVGTQRWQEKPVCMQWGTGPLVALRIKVWG